MSSPPPPARAKSAHAPRLCLANPPPRKDLFRGRSCTFERSAIEISDAAANIINAASQRRRANLHPRNEMGLRSSGPFRLVSKAEGIQHANKSWRAGLRDTRMNCIHCQTELSANYSGGNCPNCGNRLPQEQASAQGRWSMFFAMLLTPAICCFLSYVLFDMPPLGGLFGVVGGLVSGLFCTRMVIRSLAASGRRSALLSFGIGVLLCGLSFFLCGLGCSAGWNFVQSL